MTNEQKEAIELLERIHASYFLSGMIEQSNYIVDKAYETDKAIDTVLSLIKEQEKQIENTTENYKNLIEDISMLAKELGLEDDATIDEIYIAIKRLKQKDKQIDLMAEYIDEIDVSEDICEGKTMCDENCKDCVKQYFAGLVEKE